LQGKMPHWEFCSHMFMSYCMPRWNWPIICCAPCVLFIYSPMNWGIYWIISMRVMEGLQSSSFLGIICKSRSLPSAREGVQNYFNQSHNIYLSPGGNQRWLKWEFVPKENFEIEAVDRFV
jgi:hypothetical protein